MRTVLQEQAWLQTTQMEEQQLWVAASWIKLCKTCLWQAVSLTMSMIRLPLVTTRLALWKVIKVPWDPPLTLTTSSCTHHLLRHLKATPPNLWRDSNSSNHRNPIFINNKEMGVGSVSQVANSKIRTTVSLILIQILSRYRTLCRFSSSSKSQTVIIYFLLWGIYQANPQLRGILSRETSPRAKVWLRTTSRPLLIRASRDSVRSKTITIIRLTLRPQVRWLAKTCSGR